MKCISYVKFDVDVGIVVDVDIDVGVTVVSNFYDPIHFVVKFDIYVEASSCKSHSRVKKTVSPVFPLPYISQNRTENLNVATLFLHLCC